MPESTPVEAQFLLYQAEDGRTRVEVRFEGESAWLSLGQMVELFQRDKSVISRHIKNVFEEGELERASVCCRIYNDCRRRKDLSGRVLQSRPHHLGRIPGEVPPRIRFER